MTEMTETRVVKYKGFTVTKVVLFDGTAWANQGWELTGPGGYRDAFTTLAAAKAWVRAEEKRR